ncbi:MAG TPA: aspartyl protease family protein [Thermoanaerobaculia bacterium]|nr:aspartyl protease family protein [Thermoanaerobaculia bacterium]
MGLTHIRVGVANPARPNKSVRVKLLVDSGAIYSVIPTKTLERLGIQPHGERSFMLADGTEITRRIGDATFIIDGNRGASPVIFGERGDSALLGVVSLQALGFALDPIRRVLRPLPMILGRATGV